MKNPHLVRTLNILKYLAIYYLSAKMICFAIPKFLHMQFRVLHYQSYAPLVEISKYEHMWSFFGRSYNYNLFIGLAEFSIGMLIVFKRTRLIALLISLAVCINILILNIEFEITFAVQHVLIDLMLTLLLLAYYYSDLYRFFIKLGGKFEGSVQKRNKFQTWFPYFFVIALSVSYFIYAKKLKTTVNDQVVAAYIIQDLQLNDIEVELGTGRLAKEPMLFLEYNSEVVLSMRDTLYKGIYALEKDSLSLYFYPSDLEWTRVHGTIENNASIQGKTEDGRSFRMNYNPVEGDKNYLNEIYRK